jgi:hypothetical protein
MVIISTRDEDDVQPLLERPTDALGATAADFSSSTIPTTTPAMRSPGWVRGLTSSVRRLRRSPDQRVDGPSTAGVSGMRAAPATPATRSA